MVPPPLVSAASTAARRLHPWALTHEAPPVFDSSMVVVTVKVGEAEAGSTPMPAAMVTHRLAPLSMPAAIILPVNRRTRPCRTIVTSVISGPLVEVGCDDCALVGSAGHSSSNRRPPTVWHPSRPVAPGGSPSNDEAYDRAGNTPWSAIRKFRVRYGGMLLWGELPPVGASVAPVNGAVPAVVA